MTDGDDWEPLPDALVAGHPGESFEPAPAPTPPIAPVPCRAAASPREGEAALRRLQQRLDAQHPSTSLVATVQRRQDERDADRRAAHCTVHVDQLPVVADAGDDAADENDPREAEPWFTALPASERERLRAFWWHERHRYDDAGVRLRRRLGRAVVHGAFVCFVLSVLMVLLQGGFAMIPILTAAGGLAAGCAELAGGGRFLYAAAGAIVFVAVLGPAALLQPLGMIALLLTTYTMAALGMDGEMRRSAGFVRD